jgi:hypothetical protein
MESLMEAPPQPTNSANSANSASSRPHCASRARRAIEHCVAAWSNAYSQAVENNLPEDKALRMAAVAYKLQIPKMDTFASTKYAFACVTHGIALEVFEGNQASQLLYAAQVATTLYNRKGAKK